MNKTNYKFILIATSFAPQNRISAIRMSKISKYLTRLGHDVTIMTPQIDDSDIIDNSLLSPEYDQMKVIRIGNSKVFNNSLKKIRNRMVKNKPGHSYANNSNSILKKTKSYIFKVGIEYYLNLESKLWEANVIKYLKESNTSLNSAIILSSYPKLSAHNISMKLKKNNQVKLWIADFRDPLIYEQLNTNAHMVKQRKIQENISDHADLITYVSENMIFKLTSTNSLLDKFKYLPNGFDTEDLNIINTSNLDIIELYPFFLRISYVGGLYGGKRDLTKIFEQIRKLIDENKISENKIKFFYAGKEFDTLYKQASKVKLEHTIVNMGFVSRADSLAIQKQSNIVIVSTWNTENDLGVIPGKIYECFLLGKPIIAITNGTIPNSELGNMVEKSSLGIEVNSMMNDIEQDTRLNAFISEAYKHALEGNDKYLNINTKYINQFDYSNITSKLVEIVEEKLKGA